MDKKYAINIFVIVSVHILLYFFSLVPFYVEGDDASTIAHHALGKGLQPVYSMYHGMFDKYLSIFEGGEIFLRKVAVYTSFLASMFSLLTLSYLIKLKNIKLNRFSYLICFIVVDFLFMGLFINPTTLAFLFVLLAHVFLLKYQNNSKILTIILSVLFFGLGVSFRWNVGFYIFVLYADYIFKDDIKNIINANRLLKGFYIFPFYIVSVFFFIYLSGYSPLSIYETYVNASSYIENKETSYLALFAISVPFLTPSLFVACVLSLYWSLKERKIKRIMVLFFSMIPYCALGLYPSLKYMIVIIPPLFFLILDTEQLYKNKIIKNGLIILIILPFVFGIQINSNSAWGPDFSIKTHTSTIDNVDNTNYNPDKYLNKRKLTPVFMNSGCAMPTPEGPRPLWGFGKVLFKDWKGLLGSLDNERNEILDYALKNNYNIIQDVKHSFMITKLSENKFKTLQKHNNRINGELVRVFYNDNQQEIKIKVPKNKNRLYNLEYVHQNVKKDGVVIYTTYTNIISKLVNSKTINFKQKGAYWGVIKLKDN